MRRKLKYVRTRDKAEVRDRRFQAAIIDEIIREKLHPRLFERQSDFIDSVRLLADIIDCYPSEQQIVKLNVQSK